MNKIGKFAAAALLTVSGIALALPAHAIPSLRLTQGSNIVTISDNGAGDANTDLGAVAFSGSIGSFYVPIALGVTKPILGSVIEPSVDLVSLQVGGGSSIQIEFSETDFFSNGTVVDLPSLIGGTTNGTIRYQTFASLSNDLFAADILISDSGVLGPGAFSFSDFASIALSGTYSLTSVVTITHSASVTNSSFNATVEIPEPGLISMISLSGLLFVAGFGAQRRQRKR
tara:strand:- start:37127 stop:37810 length:684 start_codon:yes stop_codon:yes gene_type:complete